MTIDQLALDRLIIDQLVIDQVIDRAADAAAPDPPSGSGAAAAPRVARAVEADHLPVPWGGSRRWTDAGVVPMAPTAVATGWLTALARGDWTTAWSTTDANLRLAVAQQWLDRLGRTGDNVSAWSLAAEVPHIGMWAPFAEQLFARWTRDLDRNRPRSGDGARRPDVGRELCVLALGDEPVQHLTLRLRDRWRIAGIGRGVLQPGWPARWIDVDA